MIRSLATLLVAACVSGSLIGCAGVPAVSATASDRAKILTVRIDPKIELPEKPFYGPTQTLASLGGAVGAMLAAGNAQDEAARIAAAMHDQHAEINDIVLAEFPKAWEAATPIRFTTDPTAAVDAVMTLKINIWGWGSPMA